MIPPVNEAYRKWRPKTDFKAIAERLLGAVDQRYLAGLTAVVLTNADALNHNRRRSRTKSRGHKVAMARCLGLYHGRTPDRGAWVEIFVDRVTARESPIISFLPIFRDLAFAETLYHEIGHHIHATHAPEYREREDVADDWRARLSREYFRRRHPVARSILILLRPLIRAVKRFADARVRAGRRQAKST